MDSEEPFSFPGIDLPEEIGTNVKPELFRITPGQRFGKSCASLVFHTQEDYKRYEYYLKIRTQNSGILSCADKTCPSKAKVKCLKPSLIRKIPNFYKRADRPNGRAKYEIDREDLELRNTANWEIIERKSQKHTCRSVQKEKPGQREIRYKHTQRTFRTKRIEFRNVLRENNFEDKHGVGAIGFYFHEKAEEKSARQKLARLMPEHRTSEIPYECRYIKLFDTLTKKAEEKIFHQASLPGQEIFFLSEELHTLNFMTIFCDGTFEIVKDLRCKFQQVYILSVLYESADKTKSFTYPVAFAFQKNRTIASYEKFWNFIKSHYEKKYHMPFCPKTFKLDCEMSAIKAIRKCFPISSIKLCSVHIKRRWSQNFESFVGRGEIKKPLYSEIWKILLGSFLVPRTYLPQIIESFRRIPANRFPRGTKENFSRFLDYLWTTYFDPENARFKSELWNYYCPTNSVTIYDMSTNSLETINLKLKNKCSSGHMSAYNVFTTLLNFKKEYISKKVFAVNRNNLNPRRPKQILRNHEILQIEAEWESLSEFEQNEKFLIFSFKYGNCSPEIDFSESRYEPLWRPF